MSKFIRLKSVRLVIQCLVLLFAGLGGYHQKMVTNPPPSWESGPNREAAGRDWQEQQILLPPKERAIIVDEPLPRR